MFNLTPEAAYPWLQRARDFLTIKGEYDLGDLPTEQPHPKTADLSNLCRTAPTEAIDRLKEIDLAALNVIYGKIDQIHQLSREILDTFNQGSRVFIFGCGSSGRLALTLEFLWRSANRNSSSQNSVIAFMAGGDIALVKSVADFEDEPKYGIRQLIELGFREGDLLISATAAGETPIVLGTTEAALGISRRNPYFIYCNPDNILCQKFERAKQIIKNPRINKLNLTTGPMALCGSTRMQASTVMLAAIGAALFASNQNTTVEEELNQIIELVTKTDFSRLEPLIIEEAAIYGSQNKGVIYQAPPEYAMTVLTDTTERAPTFNLAPFENTQDSDVSPSKVYLVIPGTQNPEEAWRALLLREPRTLEWDGFENRTSLNRLYGFDISEKMISHRREYFPHLQIFFVREKSDLLRIGYKQFNLSSSVAGYTLFARNLLLKLLLNAHSTIVMGILGRFEGNSMTYVRMANNKLIDRAARCVLQILKNHGYHNISYEEVIFELFKQESLLGPDESIVIKTVQALENR